MFGKFSETIGDKLAELWTTRALTPAFAFWLMGAFLAYRKLGGDDALATMFMHWPLLLQAAALIAAFIVVVASGQLVRSFGRPVIRLLEGYEPPGLGWLFAWVRGSSTKHWNRMSQRFKELADRYEKASSIERHEYARLHLELSTLWPANAEDLMPTRIGNMLRAAETRAAERYGLDLAVVWPAFWLVLPEEAQGRLVETQEMMIDAVTLMLWALLASVAWCPLSAWTPLALVVALIGYLRLRSATKGFAAAISACIDVYRLRLYAELRLPPPKGPAAERTTGLLVTQFVLEGLDDESVVFKEQAPTAANGGGTGQ